MSVKVDAREEGNVAPDVKQKKNQNKGIVSLWENDFSGSIDENVNCQGRYLRLHRFLGESVRSTDTKDKENSDPIIRTSAFFNLSRSIASTEQLLRIKSRSGVADKPLSETIRKITVHGF